MSIIIFIVYMISMSFNYNTKFLSYNKYTIEMLSKEYLNMDLEDYLNTDTQENQEQINLFDTQTEDFKILHKNIAN